MDPLASPEAMLACLEAIFPSLEASTDGPWTISVFGEIYWNTGPSFNYKNICQVFTETTSC